jgi:hypothetical protein
MIHRVHTIVVGRNMPVIVQCALGKSAMDPRPLLWLMLDSGVIPLDDLKVQAISGLGFSRATDPLSKSAPACADFA